MSPVLLFAGAFAFVVVMLVVQARKAGPAQLSETELARCRVVQRSTPDFPQPGWSKLGIKTTAEGLRLKFDHDDDPQAEAAYVVAGDDRRIQNTLAHRRTVRLTDDFETHHVHCRGYVFRIRVRGAPTVVGKEVRIKMHVHSDGTPHFGGIENDDDTDAAVGDWIEFESVEVLEAPNVRRR